MSDEIDIIQRTLPHFDSLISDSHMKYLNQKENGKSLTIGLSENLDLIRLSSGDFHIDLSPDRARKYAKILNALADSIDMPE